MTTCDAMFKVLASEQIAVDALSQQDSAWTAILAIRYHTDGRHLQAIAGGPSPYHALLNAYNQIIWHRVNPPKAIHRGSLRALTGDDLFAQFGA